MRTRRRTKNGPVVATLVSMFSEEPTVTNEVGHERTRNIVILIARHYSWRRNTGLGREDGKKVAANRSFRRPVCRVLC